MSAMGILRIPREVELMGLDFKTLEEGEETREAIRQAEKALV